VAPPKPKARRRASAEIALLPPAEKLALLSDATVQEVIGLVDRVSQRNADHAGSALRLGTLGLGMVLGTFLALVLTGHDRWAGIVLGTGVLTILGQIISSRI
jgi:hypothetical protein